MAQLSELSCLLAFRHFRGLVLPEKVDLAVSSLIESTAKPTGLVLESFASCLVLLLSIQIMALTRRTLRRAIARRPRRAPVRKSASRTKRVSLWRQVNYSDPSDPMTLRLSTARLTNSMNPFPPSMICDLQYVDYGTVSSTGATTSTGSEYAFRLNSLFDPNLTGVGHQPRYFDQLTNIYQLYRVQVFVSSRVLQAILDDNVLCWTSTEQSRYLHVIDEVTSERWRSRRSVVAVCP